MEYLFDRELQRARRRTYGIQRLVLVAFVTTIGWLATARADDVLPRASDSVESAGAPAAQLAQSNPQVNAETSIRSPDFTVMPPPLPTNQQLTEESLKEFILHHATTHFVESNTAGNLARWRGGRQSICPIAMGLSSESNAFVTARLRALAADVGAPLQSGPQCKTNVQILFTNKPQEIMDGVREWASVYLRNDNHGMTRALIAFTSDHAIQGWYLTTNDGARVLNTDASLLALDVLPVWPQITQQYSAYGDVGTRVGGGGSGSQIGIGIVILVVDTTKVVGYSIGALADYVAMLTLSVAQSPDHCDALPSILDLVSSSCGTREKPSAITAGDLAFLKALYYKNTGLGPSLSRAEILDNMMRQFNRR